jgi:hypothetical protein
MIKGMPKMKEVHFGGWMRGLASSLAIDILFP